MTNSEIAAALDELGDLYELDGAVIYRVVAYREAAAAVRSSGQSVEELSRQGRATEIPGIGKTLAEKIAALIESGEIPAAVKLRKKFPGELVSFMHLPGLGAKTARKIHDELGISTLDELRAAAEQEQLRKLQGLGPKAEQNILTGLERYQESGPAERLLLCDVLDVGEQIAIQLRAHPAAERIEIAGSARRMTDTCKDLDIVATSKRPDELTAAFTQLPQVASVKASGEAGAKVVTHNGLAVDFRVVEPRQFGNVLQHLTGSKQHNVQLREYAVKQGQHVSEYGIEYDDGRRTKTCASEPQVYKALGMDYIEPELREGHGELQAALEHRLPKLVELNDIKGDLHCHTTLSDGRASLGEMAKAARAAGYRYLAVTDHSASFGFGDDVQPGALRKRIVQIREYNERHKGKRPAFKLLSGSEVNIQPDGSLDYPDELLAELDWVIASVHSSFRMDEQRMTDRIMAAMDNPNVDAIGHPTGRLLLKRDPYEVDVARLIEHAVETQTMLEINAGPNRRDLSDAHTRLAAEAGVMIVINSDAHGTDTLDLMRYGVATARRAWLAADQVANTLPWRTLAGIVKRARLHRSSR